MSEKGLLLFKKIYRDEFYYKKLVVSYFVILFMVKYVFIYLR